MLISLEVAVVIVMMKNAIAAREGRFVVLLLLMKTKPILEAHQAKARGIGEFLKGLPTTMTWSGLRFTAQDRIPSKYLVGVWKGRYRCSIYRSVKENNCKAALKVTFDPDKEQQFSVDATKAEHTCCNVCQVEVDENERRLPCITLKKK